MTTDLSCRWKNIEYFIDLIDGLTSKHKHTHTIRSVIVLIGDLIWLIWLLFQQPVILSNAKWMSDKKQAGHTLQTFMIIQLWFEILRFNIPYPSVSSINLSFWVAVLFSVMCDSHSQQISFKYQVKIELAWGFLLSMPHIVK